MRYLILLVVLSLSLIGASNSLELSEPALVKIAKHHSEIYYAKSQATGTKDEVESETGDYTSRNYFDTDSNDTEESSSTDFVSNHEIKAKSEAGLFRVLNVVDGDTIDIEIGGKKERLRLIGINTPETVDPRKPVECFGKEASNKAKSILAGAKVSLEADLGQGERDKYGRLLRYVFLEDGTNFNMQMIRDGFAYEYTYNTPYLYQKEFKQAQKEAEAIKAGLWGDMCNGKNSPVSSSSDSSAFGSNGCTIKGNINTNGDKIYHLIGCGSYAKTVINESQGERWFCSESEALSAAWRKALNCN